MPTLCDIACIASIAAVLVWAAAIDVRVRRIPNPAVALLLTGALVHAAFASCGFEVPLAWLPPAGERLLSSAMILVLGLLCEALWRASHSGAHGMGMGDVKLFAAAAAWLGLFVLWAVLAACLLALAVEVPRRRSTFAFGPYIALAFVACLLVMPRM